MEQDIAISEAIALDCAAGRLLLRHVSHAGREGVVITTQVALPNPVLVRVQSSCLFSESFLSIDCDCALQLREALKIVCAEGGVVLYMYEEGRGAGLRAKVDAIYLQQLTGCDTASAYKQLTLRPDPREYEVAAAILAAVVGTQTPVELISNNPERQDGLRRAGVNITRRRPLVVAPTDRIKAYLREKSRVLGHIIDEQDS